MGEKLVVSLDEYRAMPRPKVQWLVEGLIPKPGLIVLTAPPKMGKSFFALQVAIHIAIGKPVLGFQVPGPRRVLYLQLDTSELIWRDRLEKMHKSGITLPVNVLMPNPAVFQLPCIITDSKSRETCRQLLKEAEPDLVVIDVYREVHQSNENDSTEMKIVNDRIQEVFGPYAVILVHHSKKAYVNAESGEESHVSDPIAESRGSSGITGKADAIWSLRKDHLAIVPRFAERQHIHLNHLPGGLWDLTHPGTSGGDRRTEECLALMEAHPKQSPYKVYQQYKARLQAKGISQASFYRILQDAIETAAPSPSIAQCATPSLPYGVAGELHSPPSSVPVHTAPTIAPETPSGAHPDTEAVASSMPSGPPVPVSPEETSTHPYEMVPTVYPPLEMGP